MIALKDISFSYGKENILDHIHLEIERGFTAVIVGSSGCGKSTLLKIIAGQLVPTSGTIFTNSKEITSTPISKRNIGYIAQEANLFPHRSVYKNISFPLEIRNIDSKEIEKKVASIAKHMGLSEIVSRYPHELSGGQKQRVSFARAMIWKPDIVLLDEPFASLDNYSKAEMISFYNEIKVKDPFTAIFVTHDVTEALQVSETQHRLAGGKIKHYASARDFVLAPENNLQEVRNYWKNIEKLVKDE